MKLTTSIISLSIGSNNFRGEILKAVVSQARKLNGQRITHTKKVLEMPLLKSVILVFYFIFFFKKKSIKELPRLEIRKVQWTQV